MADHQKVDVTPQDIEKAAEVWHGFTTIMKWSIVGIVAVLVLLALFFVV